MTVLEGPNGSLHFSTKIQLLEGEGDRREEMGKEKPRIRFATKLRLYSVVVMESTRSLLA